MTFNLFHSPNFAANQQVSNMEIITFESNAYKELDKKITAIANYVFNHAAITCLTMRKWKRKAKMICGWTVTRSARF